MTTFQPYREIVFQTCPLYNKETHDILLVISMFLIFKVCCTKITHLIFTLTMYSEKKTANKQGVKTMQGFVRNNRFLIMAATFDKGYIMLKHG